MQGECSKNEYTHSYYRAAAVMPRSGMTTEPSDAETCLHVSISEANKSGHVRGMTEQVRHDSAPARFVEAPARFVEAAVGTKKEKAPLAVFRQEL